MAWPEDADGDVLRRLERNGFEFGKPCHMDFNVDFDAWPPAPEAIEILEKLYSNATLNEPTEDFNGYVQFQVFGSLTYDLVVSVQSSVSELMAPFGGVCESWGVLH
jgi:hypothetical protein